MFIFQCAYNIYCSVPKLCPTLCNPVDCSTRSFPVLHYLLEWAQAHVQWVSDAIQPSHGLLPPFPFGLLSFPASGSFPMIWLFVLGGQSIGASVSASVLPMNIQDWFPLGLTCLISLLSKKFSSPTHILLGDIYSLLYLLQIYVNNLTPMCSLFTGLFSQHLCLWEPFMLISVVIAYSFSLLYNISQFEHSTIYLFSYLWTFRFFFLTFYSSQLLYLIIFYG